MYEDDVKRIDEWFVEYEDYGTYHHTREHDGEDIYCVNESDVKSFCYFITAFSDIIGIPCRVGADGIWFTSKDLEEVRTI